MPVPATAKTELPLVEVFSSIQGEGPWVGARQVFVRLSGCNLACSYCDTDFVFTGRCKFELCPGSSEMVERPSPVPLDSLTESIRSWTKIPHHSLSLTGGEPLVHAELLAHCLPALQELLPIYLETNGTMVDELEGLLPWLDYISMDLKLPSVSEESELWDRHRSFLRLARTRKAYAKIVVDESTPDRELRLAAELLRDEGQGMPLVIQPVTREGQPPMSVKALFKIFDTMSIIYPHLRIIPQVHRYCGLL